MNEQLRLLVNLQEVDTAILSIVDKIEALPKKIEKAKAPLKDAYSAFEKVKIKYEELNRKKKQKEGELEEAQEKVKKLKARVSEIKTNKEYQAYLKEIERAEKEKYQIEDEIISAMETLDALTAELKKDEIEVKEAETAFAAEEKNLKEDKMVLHKDMEDYKAKRKEMVRIIDEEIYEKYMSLINSKSGLAVVQTKDEVCMGCHMNIPPQLYNDIKNNDSILACSHCNRILYYMVQKHPRHNTPPT
ncbi:MAG TPA: hypothetical protein DEP99_04350 [Nitrospiraceae bacterium]|nr:hypothetical protein [Nitrospiraceae bacterium]